MRKHFERVSKYLSQGTTCVVNTADFDTVQLLKLVEIAKASNAILNLAVSDNTPMNVIDLVADTAADNLILDFRG